MKKVFAKKYMVVFQREEHDEFVVYNTHKEWEQGHTHIHSYKQAMYLVDCILNNKIPKKVNKYFLVSLQRLATSKKYKEQIQRRLNGDTKEQYHNTPKHYRK